jgi:hypothetical protein
LLYPTELSALGSFLAKTAKKVNGAGDGNRTHVASLEGWSFTIKQHPHKYHFHNRQNLLYNKSAGFSTIFL